MYIYIYIYGDDFLEVNHDTALPELSRAIGRRWRRIRRVVQVVFLGGQLPNPNDDLPLSVSHQAVVQEDGVGVGDVRP